MRSHIQGMHEFAGPKKLALLRMLNRATQQGGVVVVILPVAPAYAHEFLTREVRAAFENTLADVQRAAPKALFVRLDQLPALDSNEYFSDLVHFNSAGRQITTEAFLSQLKQQEGRR